MNQQTLGGLNDTQLEAAAIAARPDKPALVACPGRPRSAPALGLPRTG